MWLCVFGPPLFHPLIVSYKTGNIQICLSCSVDLLKFELFILCLPVHHIVVDAIFSTYSSFLIHKHNKHLLPFIPNGLIQK